MLRREQLQKRKICRKVRPGAAQTEGWNLLTDEKKDAIRAKVTADLEDLAEKTAPWYLGRFCPEFNGECKGPYCQKFLPTDMRGEGKITGAACAVTLDAVQAASISNALSSIADVAARSLRPVAPGPGLIKPG